MITINIDLQQFDPLAFREMLAIMAEFHGSPGHVMPEPIKRGPGRPPKVTAQAGAPALAPTPGSSLAAALQAMDSPPPADLDGEFDDGWGEDYPGFYPGISAL